MKGREDVRAFTTNPVLQRRLAKHMVLHCFRNSMLEDLHAGISPSSAVGDYSDVTVSSPYGVIPWPEVSRLNDEEMERLMIDVVNRAYRFIHTLFDEKPALHSCFCLRIMIPAHGGTNQRLKPQKRRTDRAGDDFESRHVREGGDQFVCETSWVKKLEHWAEAVMIPRAVVHSARQANG